MATDVITAASGRWRDILEVLAGLHAEQLSNRHQPCPACGGRDRYRFDDRDGNGSCSAINAVARTTSVVAEQEWTY